MRCFCRATSSVVPSETSNSSDSRKISFPPQISQLSELNHHYVRKLCSSNSFFTQLLSFVFLPFVVLRCNHHQSQIDQFRIYRKAFISPFLFNLINSFLNILLVLSDVISLTDNITTLVYQNCHFTEQQGSHLRAVHLLLTPHWPHPSRTGVCLKCSQTTVHSAICVTRTI